MDMKIVKSKLPNAVMCGLFIAAFCLIIYVSSLFFSIIGNYVIITNSEIGKFWIFSVVFFIAYKGICLYWNASIEQMEKLGLKFD
jgi:hypothetical protein